SLRVMFPMIADIGEFDNAREIFNLELDRQRKADETLPAEIAVGLMLEVPALIWQLPALAGRADFISVGTNDLLQFLFAADRGNPRLAGRYDPLSPSVLRVLGQIAAGCAMHHLPVTVCGEMAGDPIEAMA